MKEHSIISIDKILVNPDNPRNAQVLINDEILIMQHLIRTPSEAKAMHKLITDIYTDGWYPQSIITVTYDEAKDKYIAWDGNRRLTAMKILQQPSLVEELKHFSYLQKQNIYMLSKNIERDGFFEVPCYVADSFEVCAQYIRSIHTTDTGALKWDSAAIKRFENKFGSKNIFAQLSKFCPSAFDKIDENFPVEKFEKIAISRAGKEFLDISFDDGILMPLSDAKELSNKLKKLVKEVQEGKITIENLKNNKKIESLLNKEIKTKEEITEAPKTQSTIKEVKTKVKEEKNVKNDKLSENKKQIPNQIEIKIPTKFSSIRSDNNYIQFKLLDISKLDKKNERYIGIRNLAYEIKKLSTNAQYKVYPISYCFLIRSLLEQTSIYFLIKRGKWEKWKSENNNKELRLEKILEKIGKDKQNLIVDDTISRLWEVCFNNYATKNYFDLVIHHPYKVIANEESIKAITNSGIFSIIQFFINVE